LSPLLPAAGGRVLRIGVDARSLQPGFREDSARGIGVYARELLRVLAARQDLALTLWFEPALPVLNGLVPPGVLTRRYALGSLLAILLPIPLALCLLVHGLLGAPLYTALLLHAQSWAGAIGLIGTLGLVASGVHIVASSLEQPREWRQTI